MSEMRYEEEQGVQTESGQGNWRTFMLAREYGDYGIKQREKHSQKRINSKQPHCIPDKSMTSWWRMDQSDQDLQHKPVMEFMQSL